jgi:hypothetical protein
MSEVYSIESFADLEQQTRTIVEQQRAGRREVSNAQFLTLTGTLVVIVGCLAAQNALYGQSQGGTLAAMVLLAVLYFAGDIALATLTSLDTRRAAAASLGAIAKVGLILLSLVSGIAFMLSQQAQTDQAASQIPSLERQIAANEEAFARYHKTITADRLESLKRQLAAERSRVGGDHAATNAIYVYASKLTGYSFEAVSFAIRATWIAIFILTGMSLSSYLGLLWCPWKDARAVKNAVRSHARAMSIRRYQLEIFKAHRAVSADIEAVEAGSSDRYTRRSRSSGRAPTQDTKVSGKTSKRYNEIRTLVANGTLNPSVASVRRAAGCGTATAQAYLRQLADEQVIGMKNNRYAVMQ